MVLTARLCGPGLPASATGAPTPTVVCEPAADATATPVAKGCSGVNATPGPPASPSAAAIRVGGGAAPAAPGTSRSVRTGQRSWKIGTNGPSDQVIPVVVADAK